MLQIQVNAPKVGRTFDYQMEIGETLQDLVERFGEEKILLLAKRMFATDLQNKLRRMMTEETDSAGQPYTDEFLQKTCDEFEPGQVVRDGSASNARALETLIKNAGSLTQGDRDRLLAMLTPA
jgi:hypothetical protein